MNYNKIPKPLGLIPPLNMPLKHGAVFAFFCLSTHCILCLHSLPMSLSCSRGSPSRGGILTPTLLLYAACSPDAAWSPSPARLRSCTWSNRTARWESRTWPSPWGYAASVWGCSTALEGEGEMADRCAGEPSDRFMSDSFIMTAGRTL